jgi:hypothetical protein
MVDFGSSEGRDTAYGSEGVLACASGCEKRVIVINFESGECFGEERDKEMSDCLGNDSQPEGR